MRKGIRWAAMVMAAILILTGCREKTDSNDGTITDNTQRETTTGTNGGNNNQSTTDSKNESSTNSTYVEESVVPTVKDMFTDRDYRIEYDKKDSVLIELKGDSASCSSKAVEISGSVVTIKDEGTYIISGTLNDGKIVVEADDKDKLQIVFDNVNIISSNSAPIYIIEADKVFITMADGSNNVLANGGTFDESDEYGVDAAIFSKQDLTLNGSGSLTVTSPAGHGITSKDDLVLTSGTYTINAASHGLDANNSVRIADAIVTINAGKDGVHAENSDYAELGFVYVLSGTLNIEAEGDGVSAGAYMQIEGGSFDIVTGGGSVNAAHKTSNSWGGMGGGRPGGMMRPGQQQPSDSSQATEDNTSSKALKAANSLLINDGVLTIDSADDAIHANADVVINGGIFEIASGDDGFHADEALTITAGTINITKSYEGLEGLDITISGGDITLAANDDGINAAGGTDSSGFGGMRGNDRFGGMGGGMMSAGNGSIEISGGNIYIKASGDGIDANGTLLISGGMVTVCGPTIGDTAVLDYDRSAVITGGTFIGTGSSMMAQTFSDSKQGVIALGVGSQSAGTDITIKDSEGKLLVSYEPALDFQIVIISTPDMVSGETYTVDLGLQTREFMAK